MVAYYNSLEYKREAKRKHWNRKMAVINEWRSTGCAFCGEKDIIVLEAHHIEDNDKNDKIKKSKHKSYALHNLSWDELNRELKKCIVLCANCHRRETHRLRTLKKEMM